MIPSVGKLEPSEFVFEFSMVELGDRSGTKTTRRQCTKIPKHPPWMC
jgi:hypothetical protein